MRALEKANEIIGKISVLVDVSIVDVVSSAFITMVTFFVNLLLGA